METIVSAFGTKERKSLEDFMISRQHSPGGNLNIFNQISKHFKLPVPYLNLGKINTLEVLENIIYQSQVSMYSIVRIR